MFLSFVLLYLFSQKAGPIRDVISSGIDNKCHWWSGYDLLRRLLFFIVYLMFENFSSGYTQVSDTLVVNLVYHHCKSNQDGRLLLSKISLFDCALIQNDNTLYVHHLTKQ